LHHREPASNDGEPRLIGPAAAIARRGARAERFTARLAFVILVVAWLRSVAVSIPFGDRQGLADAVGG